MWRPIETNRKSFRRDLERSGNRGILRKLRRPHGLLLLMLLSGYPETAPAATRAGAEFPDTLELEGVSLVLNGAGIRRVFFIDAYAAGLYLQQKSSDADQILAADEPMALELEIVTGLQAGSRMGSPIEKGFEQSTGGNTASGDLPDA